MSQPTKNEAPASMHSFLSPAPDLKGRSILVTGGTGSFGQQLIGRLLKDFELSRLVVFSRDEAKQYDMAQKFPEADHKEIRYFIGDVRNVERLEMAMRGIDIVVHAAALKQVPAAEYNPFECIRTNVIGAENVVTAAIRAGVDKIVALSTDKAVNPANLYGASKLASDKIFVAANNLSAGQPACSVVRYGNVIGSRGSVVPMFRRLVAENKLPLPITDERMTRFWITLDQGVDFVLSSLEMMEGGEIFVPKIPSMKLLDLVQAITPGAAHRTVGIRPGEKLHEVLISQDDSRSTIELDDRYIVCPPWMPVEKAQDAYNGGPVAEDFLYASNNNDQWLSVDGLQRLIDES